MLRQKSMQTPGIPSKTHVKSVQKLIPTKRGSASILNNLLSPKIAKKPTIPLCIIIRRVFPLLRRLPSNKTARHAITIATIPCM